MPFGSIVDSILSAKNNKLLRYGHTYYGLNKKLKRKIRNPENSFKEYHRKPEELLALRHR